MQLDSPLFPLLRSFVAFQNLLLCPLVSMLFRELRGSSEIIISNIIGNYLTFSLGHLDASTFELPYREIEKD